MKLNFYSAKDYENKRLCSRGEIKPKQTQTNSKRSGDPLRVSFSESSNRGPIKPNLARHPVWRVYPPPAGQTGNEEKLILPVWRFV